MNELPENPAPGSNSREADPIKNQKLQPRCSVEQPWSKFKNSPPFLRPRRLYGSIAQLPKETRLRINQMLDDGLTFAQIIKNLGDEGKALTRRCVQGWKARGYQDYLRQQRLLEQCRARTEAAFNSALAAGPTGPFHATQQIASAQICEVITDLGPDILREAIAANPLNYFRMLNAFARIANSGIFLQGQLAAETQNPDQPAAATQPKKGLSPATVQEMNAHLNLM